MEFSEEQFMACCGSTRFGQEMAKACPFNTLSDSIEVARDIWFNKLDVNGVLQAFAAHPQIGGAPPSSSHPTSAQWSKGEQSTAIATASSSSLQELSEWNARYHEKFGFMFLIYASGRSTDEILAELKRRYTNRPIAELQIAAEEQMKITELRLAKLFSTIPSSTGHDYALNVAKKAGEERVSVVGGHVTPAAESPAGKKKQTLTRSRPPITTHVLDVSRGSPGAGIDVRLEMWKGHHHLAFGEKDNDGWVLQGSSMTDKDGRSGQLMSIVDDVEPGIYRLSFNVGKYYRQLGAGLGFFPYVSIVFEIGESQRSEHFHVPLLLSPFSFTTYRGS